MSDKEPSQTSIDEICERTGYKHEVTPGQRKYGGPPPDWEGSQPGKGHEVFCGRVPGDVFEDQLIPLFEECGKIWDLRLMMDSISGSNRGFCFITYCDRDGAKKAVSDLDGHEIQPGRKLKVNISIGNTRLFVGNIPKNKDKEEIQKEFLKITEGLAEVIIYSAADDPKKKNRGFCFLEYDSHKNAAMAKRRLQSGRYHVWNCDILVDWADPLEEPDEDVMSKVKVLYVRNLTSDVTEDQLKEAFEKFGEIERVKKIRDYGFIHFKEREHALKAMEEMNGSESIGKNAIQVLLAKPPSQAAQRKKDQRKREADFRQRCLAAGFDPFVMSYNRFGGQDYSQGGNYDAYYSEYPAAGGYGGARDSYNNYFDFGYEDFGGYDFANNVSYQGQFGMAVPAARGRGIRRGGGSGGASAQ